MILPIGIPEALQSLRPGAEWSVRDNEIDWLDTIQSKPTDEEIEAEIQRLKDERAANEYRTKRSAEYPPIGDQLDALYHAGLFPADMAAKLQAVKDKYPKQ